ncbi:Phox/Bem1p [Plasmopara halstedii]|uniref:Phox/Bem1p n=1 Tax=Plasmopara halstedii TaxID=4781 RepID=A0A0P1APL3_PLAHL|nr:Phox/Bem1p [Plasmopara halstedii]CEG43200.1 Phox/Bem1p [Plasmopara halstedii]|eukprot:XP_024579569.1 Phox/Bem1p [Plasmopara halstedii]
MTESVELTLSYAGQSHKMTVPLCSANPKDDLSYELVRAKVQETFPRLLDQRWTLVYRDDEGDVVTVSHSLEFDEACHVLFAMNPQDNDKLRTLHFFVLKRVTFRDKLVAPVLQKIMELARLAREATKYMRNVEVIEKSRKSVVKLANNAVNQAGETINQIRNSEVLGRGRASLGNSAAHTRTLLLSARSGVSTQLRRASSAVVAGIERRRSSSGSVSDFDPTNFIKPSASVTSPSMELAETVDLRQPVVVTTLAPTELTAEESDDEPPALLMATDAGVEIISGSLYESDTDTLCDDDDRDWNNIGAASGKDVIVESDGDWSHQLNVIREILGQVDEERCYDLLNQYNGDVEVVLVELTKM